MMKAFLEERLQGGMRSVGMREERQVVSFVAV